MSKAEVCKFVLAHTAYHMEEPAVCPQIDDFVTVETTTPSSPAGGRVQLIFHDDTVHAMWSSFPTEEFFNVVARLKKDYGKPELVWSMTAGHTEIRFGPYKENRHATNASELVDGTSSHGGTLPGMAVPGFTNGYLYWRVKHAHVFLEQQNE